MAKFLRLLGLQGPVHGQVSADVEGQAPLQANGPPALARTSIKPRAADPEQMGASQWEQFHTSSGGGSNDGIGMGIPQHAGRARRMSYTHAGVKPSELPWPAAGPPPPQHIAWPPTQQGPPIAAASPLRQSWAGGDNQLSAAVDCVTQCVSGDSSCIITAGPSGSSAGMPSQLDSSMHAKPAGAGKGALAHPFSPPYALLFPPPPITPRNRPPTPPSSDAWAQQHSGLSGPSSSNSGSLAQQPNVPVPGLSGNITPKGHVHTQQAVPNIPQCQQGSLEHPPADVQPAPNHLQERVRYVIPMAAPQQRPPHVPLLQLPCVTSQPPPEPAQQPLMSPKPPLISPRPPLMRWEKGPAPTPVNAPPAVSTAFPAPIPDPTLGPTGGSYNAPSGPSADLSPAAVPPPAAAPSPKVWNPFCRAVEPPPLQRTANPPPLGLPPRHKAPLATNMWGGSLMRRESNPGTTGIPVPDRSSQSFSVGAAMQCPLQPVPFVPFHELSLGLLVGEGGFGKVYFGHWNGQEVAIKVAAPRNGDNASCAVEFQREVATQATIPPHPNIVKMLAACSTPPDLALVTEYCARGSLFQALHNPMHPPMDHRQLLNLWLGIASGMAWLHNQSPPVLHRDLKSANILLTDTGVPRISDFGLARIYGGLNTQVLTGGLGTFQWMAPEVMSHQAYSAKADVYSFGMVIWECLARKLPFSGLTMVQTAMGVINQGLRPPFPDGTPPQVAELVNQCWAAVPDQRPSFNIIATRLQGMLDSDAAPAVVPIQPMQPHEGMSPQHQSEPGQTTWGQDGVQWAGQAPTPHPPQAGQQLVHGSCVGAVGPPPGPPLPIPILPRAPGPSPRGQAAQIPRQATGPMQGPMKATALPTTSASAHGVMHILPAYPTHPAPPQPLEAVLMHALSGLQLHTGMNIGLGEGRGKGGSEGGSRRGGAGMWDRHSSPGGMGGSEV